MPLSTKKDARLEGRLKTPDAVGSSHSVKNGSVKNGSVDIGLWTHVMYVSDTEKTVTRLFSKYISDTNQLTFCENTLAEIIVNIVENERKDNPEPRLCAELKDHPFNQSCLVLCAQGHNHLLAQMFSQICFLITENMNKNEVLNHEKELIDKVSTEVPVCDLIKYWIGTKVIKDFGRPHGWLTGKVTSYDGTYYQVTYDDGDKEEYDDREMKDIVPTPARPEGCDDEYEFVYDNTRAHTSTTNSNIPFTMQDETNANAKKQDTMRLERTHAESQGTCVDQANEPAKEDDVYEDAPIHSTERLTKKRTSTPLSGSTNTTKETKNHQADAKKYVKEHASGTNATVSPKKRKATRMQCNSRRPKKQRTDGLSSNTNTTKESKKYKAHKNGNNAATNTSSASHRNNVTTNLHNVNRGAQSHKKSVSKKPKVSYYVSIINKNETP